LKTLKVEISKQALSDVREIARWVYENSRSASTAERYAQRVFDACDRIGARPFAGQRCDEVRPRLRSFPFERRALILYLVKDDVVLVTNVLHAGRDVAALYRGPPID
jgi:toxin ParE1/3/4